MIIKVRHWHYNSGWRFIPPVIRDKHDGADKEYDPGLVGWHCWIFSPDWEGVEDWLENHMQGDYDCCRRFNSGDPMMTLHIKDGEDAIVFKLTWM